MSNLPPSVLNQFEVLKSIDIPNETYFYRELGSGPNVIVLIHGNLQSSFVYSLLVPKLLPEFRIIAIDMKGCGDSTYHIPIRNHYDFAIDIKNILDKLQISKCSMLGYSTGGAITICFAITYPEMIDKVILLSSVGPKGYCDYSNFNSMDYQKDENGLFDVDKVLDKSPLAEHEKIVKEKNKDKLLSGFDDKLFQFNKMNNQLVDLFIEDAFKEANLRDYNRANAIFNVTNEATPVSLGDEGIKKYKAETLILHGENDVIIPVSDAKNWKIIIGAKAKLKTFENCGHFIFIDRLTEIANLINDFFLSKDSK